MKNTLTDLNNHLFSQLERLGDEDLKGEELQDEIERAKAITVISTQIISTGSLALKAKTFAYEYGSGDSSGSSKKFPPMLRAEFLGE